MEFWEALLLAGITGLVSAAGTVASIRTDISWIKDALKDHGTRLTNLEEKKL